MSSNFMMTVQYTLLAMWVIWSGWSVYAAMHFEQAPMLKTEGLFSVAIYYYALFVIALITISLPVMMAYWIFR